MNTIIKTVSCQLSLLDKRQSDSVLQQNSWVFILLLLFGSINLKAQEPNPALPAGIVKPQNETPILRRFSLGVSIAHLYDIRDNAFNKLSSGYTVDDPYGMNGSKTKFDIAPGLTLSYFLGPLASIDFGYEAGKMTGATKDNYYESNVSFFTLGGNFSFKRSCRTKDYNFVPYARLSFARGSYDAQRKLISDEGVIGEASGTCLVMGIGLGLRYYINDVWSLNLMSEYHKMNTGEWDGYYDVGTGKDQMIKTTMGLKYAFGRGQHVDRTLAWQDNRVDQMQTRIDGQVNDAIKTINDSVDNRFNRIMNQPGTRDSDDDGVVDKFDKCPDVAGLLANNGCPPLETLVIQQDREAAVDNQVEKIAAVTPDTKSSSGETKGLTIEEKYRLKNEILVEMNTVRFNVNSYQLNAKAYEQLNTVAVILRNNPSYTITVKGYTDEDGSAAFNKKLAEQRANSVVEYLESRSISKDRIKILAIGKSEPLDDNVSSIGKANNRRVEIRLN